jgi:hypothetical protein
MGADAALRRIPGKYIRFEKDVFIRGYKAIDSPQKINAAAYSLIYFLLIVGRAANQGNF